MAVTLTPAELKGMGYQHINGNVVRITAAEAIPTPANDNLARSGPIVTSVVEPRSPYKSKTEAAYAGRLHVLQRAGDIREWSYEAVTLRLADRVRFTCDFRVILRDGTAELHEVKGAFVREDARVKLQVAATMYPEYRFVLAQLRKGSWSLTPVRAL